MVGKHFTSIFGLTLVLIAVCVIKVKTHDDDRGLSVVRSNEDRTLDRRPRSTNSRSDDQESNHAGRGSHSNCSQCSGSSEVNRDAKRNYRLESIKADILRKLHLRAPPNITGRQLPAPPHLQQLIEKLSIHQNDGPDYEMEGIYGNPGASAGYNDDVDDERATTMKVIQFCKPVPADRQLEPSVADNSCYFPFPMSEVRQIDQIVRLTFGVYVRAVPYDPRSGPSRQSLVVLYMLGPHGSQRYLGKKSVSLSAQSTGRWYHFRLQASDIQSWLTHPNTNYGLLIQSSNGRGEPLAVVTPQTPAEEPFKPYLEVETRDASHTRVRRTVDRDCHEHSPEKRCCRYPLEVDFASFQWNWIIVPTRYSAYFCSGECPYLFMQQHGNSYVSQLARPSGSAGPCCSPRKVSSISMLYYDQNMNIVYGRLPGMVVDRCGCA